MKKILQSLFAIMVMVTGPLFAQQQPTIMVVPSDVWCNKKGYMTSYADQGRTVKVPDYNKALQEDDDLEFVIGKIGQMFADRGFPLQNLKEQMDKISRDNANRAALSGSKAQIKESPLDVLNRTAKADIILKTDWTVIEKGGGRRTVRFTITPIDPYTGGEAGGGASGESATPTTESSVSKLIEEAVLANITNLQTRMEDYFKDLRANGRKVSIKVMVAQAAKFNLEDECNGTEYTQWLDDWMHTNAVNGKYIQEDATENAVSYNQVRIPLKNESGRDYNAQMFGQKLQKEMQEKCGLKGKVKLIRKGVGECWLVLGGK
jgi:hypothetical protein